MSEAPGLLDSLHEAIINGEIWEEQKINIVSWFVVKLGCASKKSRENTTMRELADELCEKRSAHSKKLRLVFHGTGNGACGHGVKFQS